MWGSRGVLTQLVQAEIIQTVSSDRVKLLIQIEQDEGEDDAEDDAEGGEWVVEQTVLKDWVGSSSAGGFLSWLRQVSAVEPSSVPTEVLRTLPSCT